MLVNKLSVIGYVIIIIIIKTEASASLNWREKMCMIPERICHYSNVGCGYSCDFCWEMNTVNGWFSENECFDSVLRLYKISNVRKSNINKCWILIHCEGIWRALRQLENSQWYFFVNHAFECIGFLHFDRLQKLPHDIRASFYRRPSISAVYFSEWQKDFQ